MGFTLVEVMLGFMILTVGAGGSLTSVIASMRVGQINRETALAQLAARGAMEALLLTDFDEVFASYNQTAVDDGGLIQPAMGANFAVAGLSAQEGDLDGLPGRVVFPLEGGVPLEELREDILDPFLGMPHDLNGDGLIDGLDHSGDYIILPVRVLVEWQGAGGVDRTMGFETFLTDR